MLLFQFSNYHSYRAGSCFAISILFINMALPTVRNAISATIIECQVLFSYDWNLRQRWFLLVSSVTFTFLYVFYEWLINLLFDLCQKVEILSVLCDYQTSWDNLRTFLVLSFHESSIRQHYRKNISWKRKVIEEGRS